MNPKRILVVDDNVNNLTLVITLLEMDGYRVFSAATAEAAIAAASDLRPDLILMDVALPGMDGLEATRILRASAATSGTCIVALSACAMPEDIANARRSGCDGYITKPICVHEFRSEVARLLGIGAEAPES